MSSLEALSPDGLEKHVQLNCARLTSCGVLREEIKTYSECRGHENARNTRQKGSHHTQEETTRWTVVHLGKARANKAKASTARAKAKASKDSMDSMDRTRTRARTRTRIRLNVEIVENVDTTRKTVGARRTPKVVRKENTNPRMQMLTILTRNHQLLNQKLNLMNSA